MVVDTHCPQVQGEEKHRRDVHACADLSQPSSPMVQRAVPQLSWELPDLELGKGFSAMS